MKSLFTVTFACVPLLVMAAEPPAKSGAPAPRKSVPGEYPAIIQLTPATDAMAKSGEPGRLITSDLGGREIEFFHKANEVGLRQLALANLAKEKGVSDQLQAVASTLLTTQIEENRQVARVAVLKGVSLAPPQRDPAGDFGELAGAKFEKAWIERLVAVNRQAVEAFEIGVRAQDPEIRSFAEKLLPLEKSKLLVANRLAGNAAKSQPEIIDPVVEPAAADEVKPPSAPRPSSTPTAAAPMPGTSTKAPQKSATPKPAPKASPARSSKKVSTARKSTAASSTPAPVGLMQWLRGERGSKAATGNSPSPIASGSRSVLRPFWKKSASAGE